MITRSFTREEKGGRTAAAECPWTGYLNSDPGATHKSHLELSEAFLWQPLCWSSPGRKLTTSQPTPNTWPWGFRADGVWCKFNQYHFNWLLAIRYRAIIAVRPTSDWPPFAKWWNRNTHWEDLPVPDDLRHRCPCWNYRMCCCGFAQLISRLADLSIR